MKFGKRLEAEAIPEWRLKYVNYKQLKSLLEKIPVAADSPLRPSALTLPSMHQRLSAHQPQHATQRPYSAEEQAFIDRLQQEVRMVDDFFQAREKDAIDRKFKILAQLQVLPQKKESYTHESGSHEAMNAFTWGSQRSAVASSEEDVSQATTPRRKQHGHDEEDDLPEHVKIRSFRRSSFSHLARLRIKKALLEYYRSLELLKSYRQLNLTALHKILKKFDKITGRHSEGWLRSNVEGLVIARSRQVEGLLEDVENIYRYVFTGGDRGKALRKLRIVDLRQKTFYRSAVVAGAGLAASGTLAYSAAQTVYASLNPTLHYLFYVYAALYLPIFMALLFTINGAVWEAYHINYRFIFEFNQRNMLHNSQYLLLTTGMSVAYLGWAWWSLNGAAGWLNRFIPPLYQAWVPVAALFLFMLAPLPIAYRSTRWWFDKVMFRIAISGFYPVRFKDFFVADQLMSLGFTFEALGWLIDSTINPPVVSAMSPLTVRMRPRWFIMLLALLPGIWRSLQCFRRYRDTGMWFPHLANLAKYFCGLLVPVVGFWASYNAATRAPAVWVARAIASLFSLGWDVVMDFGLLQKGSQHALLRNTLLFHQPWIYFALVIFDASARALWLLPILLPKLQPTWFGEQGQLPVIALAAGLAVIEVVRRIIWNFFRVEYEQINNCNCLKAINEVALPFTATDLFYQDMAKMEAAKVGIIKTGEAASGETDEEEEDEEEEDEASSNVVAVDDKELPVRIDLSEEDEDEHRFSEAESDAEMNLNLVPTNQLMRERDAKVEASGSGWSRQSRSPV